jgi:hypothetical protein
MALITYDSQVSFAKQCVKSGLINRGGTWRHHLAWGHSWYGIAFGYSIHFETIGDGPLMRAGSFRVRAMKKSA